MPVKPRTVLILTPSSRLLGARRSLLALAESLDPERWRPVVCGQSDGQLGEALAERGIPMHIVKLGWWRKAKYLLWRPFAIARLAALARQVGADLIHCNEIYPNPYAVRAASHVPSATDSPRGGRPIPVLTHVRLGMKPGMIRKYDLPKASRLAVPSEALAREIMAEGPASLRVQVIHNGVNMEEYTRTRSAEAARAQIGLPLDCLLLGAIGQVGPRKGGDLVLEAFARLAEQLPKLHLMFVGDSHKGQEEFADKLRLRAMQAPWGNRVHFFPFTEQVMPFYEASDINLLISRDEGFGRTIIEAGALGIPSIGARVGGISEIIVDGTTGRLVPAEDPAALTQAIAQLVQDEVLRRQWGDNAFKRTAQLFSIRAHTAQIMDLYDDLVMSAE
jgi:glycosyltransferase involved in cell wall biosynthesis